MKRISFTQTILLFLLTILLLGCINGNEPSGKAIKALDSFTENDYSVYATVKTTVISKQGAPIEGAKARLFQESIFMAEEQSNAFGTVFFRKIAIPTTYSVSATKQGFAPAPEQRFEITKKDIYQGKEIEQKIVMEKK